MFIVGSVFIQASTLLSICGEVHVSIFTVTRHFFTGVGGDEHIILESDRLFVPLVTVF